MKFADTKEGFFAIRLADSMAGKNGGLMTNAEGAQTEKNVWGKKSAWVDYDGTVDGQKVGIVIFNNPKNGDRAAALAFARLWVVCGESVWVEGIRSEGGGQGRAGVESRAIHCGCAIG